MKDFLINLNTNWCGFFLNTLNMSQSICEDFGIIRLKQY